MTSIFGRAPYSASVRSISERMLEEEQRQHESHRRSKRPPIKRLVERDLPYHQSSNFLRVRHQIFRKSSYGVYVPRFFHWYAVDWFHVLLRVRTIVSVFFFVALWTLFLLLFAGIYVAIDSQNPGTDCGLGEPPYPIAFYAAFAFSLETTTTVGYGLPNGGNGFFESCPWLQVAVYFHMLISMFFNASLLSIVFARLSRSEKRGNQVLFSDKATLNRETLPGGIHRYVLSARVYDADSMYPLVEAHVRFYAVKHGGMHSMENADARYPIKMEPMRVSAPNDDLGASLYTSLPTAVMHHIDYHSPLNPPGKRRAGPEDGRVQPDSGFVSHPCGVDLREVDSYTGNRDGLRCAVCGETYATVTNLVQHIRYNQHTEKYDEVPVEGSHRELDVDALFAKRRPPRSISEGGQGVDENDLLCAEDAKVIDADQSPGLWYAEYRRYMESANIEIICVVEAIDPILSGTFHALQSYTIEDVIFDAEFAPCILTDGVGGGGNESGWLGRIFVGRNAAGHAVKVDLDSFHQTVPLNGQEKQ